MTAKFYVHNENCMTKFSELNEFYNFYPARENRGSSPGVYSPAVDGN